MIIINTEAVGKCYSVPDSHREKHDTFLGAVAIGARHAWRQLFAKEPADQHDNFWALRDVSFSIKEGDRVGLIGRNGSGKSTLLKIISRVTEPTKGRITLRGRVRSLLEVGTGFHPELTGRENIYLNGAILGMSYSDVNRKFDEIVDFAEIGHFLDMPVKRYSSGMYVRLAFAVATQLESEILILDEVLAVGDVQFQKKCIRTIEKMAEQGRTILFVSHNMDAVQQLCHRILWLESGRLVADSEDTVEVYGRYLSSTENQENAAPGNDVNTEKFLSIRQVYVGNEVGLPYMGAIPMGTELYLYIDAYIYDQQSDLNVGYALRTADGLVLYLSCAKDRDQEDWPNIEAGKCVLRTQIPSHFLNEGLFHVEVMVGLQLEMHRYDHDNCPVATFTIQGGFGSSPYWTSRRDGVLAPVFPWKRVD